MSSRMIFKAGGSDPKGVGDDEGGSGRGSRGSKRRSPRHYDDFDYEELEDEDRLRHRREWQRPRSNPQDIDPEGQPSRHPNKEN